MRNGSKIDPGNNITRMAKLGNVGETCTRNEPFPDVSGNARPRFIETDARKNSSRKVPAKVECNLES